MELSDFERNGKGISNTIPIEDRNFNIYIRQEDDDDLFKISCYGYKVPIKYITGKKTLKEVEEVVKDICKKLEWAWAISDNLDLNKFVAQLTLDYPKQPKNTRLHLESADGKISMFVEAHKDFFVPKVKDFQKDTPIVKEAHLHSRVVTEEECERILKEKMNEYDCFGYYTRTLKRSPRYLTEHEKKSIDSTSVKGYSIENIESKEEYDFLLKQQELFKNMKGE